MVNSLLPGVYAGNRQAAGMLLDLSRLNKPLQLSRQSETILETIKSSSRIQRLVGSKRGEYSTVQVLQPEEPLKAPAKKNGWPDPGPVRKH